MKIFLHKILAATALLGLLCSCNGTRALTVASPGKTKQLTFELNKQGAPQYRLSHKDKVVIAPSALGFEFDGLEKMTDNFKIVSTQTRIHDTSWEQPWGEFRNLKDQHNELIVHLREKSGQQREVAVVFRVFEDGMGFRYQFPKQPNLDKVKISNEVTEFALADDQNVWWIPVHRENSYYESTYRKTLMSQTDTINTPATFETKDKLFVAIHEANLTDFASMTLLKTTGNRYKSELVPWRDGVKVYAQTPFETPWRTVMVGEQPGDLTASTLTLNLNEPSKIDDTSWIETSKYAGIWWGMHLEKYSWGQGPKHGATTENTKRYLDFAANHGLDGILVEGWNYGWDGDWTADGTSFSFTKPYPDFDIEAITKYAQSKNVRLIGHHETAGATQHYESQMDDAFKMYEKLGVHTVKTGYVNKYLDKKEWHDSQYGVRHYRKVIETAAQYHIMIDNHEPVKGTGLQRTWPNLMTQEGGRGQEYNAWSSDGGNTPEYLTTLPFTRMLAGPFDYTPGNFDFGYKLPQGAKVQTTLANQLALYVIIYSPLQMASDLPENYLGKPEFKFIREVPCKWNQTRVIDAKIGDYVVMARQDWEGKNWYLGAISNRDARKLQVPLDFLEKGKSYQAELYLDGDGADYRSNPYPVKMETRTVKAGDVLEVHLASGGGAAVKFKAL